ncbi:phospholipase A [Sphingomonas sp. CJ99]
MRILLAAAFLFAPIPLAAQTRILPDRPADAVAAVGGVPVFVVNEGPEPAEVPLPTRMSVIAADGAALTLFREGDATVTVPAGGFVRARYRNVDPRAVALARASMPAVPPPPADPIRAPLPTSPVESVDLPPSEADPADGGVVESDRDTEAETVMPDAGPAADRGFLTRFRPHEPVYGAFGTGDDGAKLQLSLAFQPFADDSALSSLRVAWTQTLFWAIQEPSGPIREQLYSPEVFWQQRLADGWNGAVGWRHDSNGKGPAGSIDANRIYARVTRSFDLGDGWSASVTPQAWFYVGTQGIAPDLADYWGYGAVGAGVAQEDGLKLAATMRGNPAIGRGAVEGFVSYPLNRIGGGVGIAVFGQVFTGFGENLSDYRVRSTAARLGIAFVR